MEIIESTRELGRALQQDERYLAMRVASANCDDDAVLQDLIGAFNLKRMAINNEAQKEEQDSERLQQLNEEMRHDYAQIMQNPNMTVYNNAKTAMDELLQRVSAIIGQCADGEDPATAEAPAAHSCGGECGSCGGGCH